MRLRLSILRNDLPSVSIVFKPSGIDPTIADLLKDISLIVPLEDADGQWGLEDYVVEVVASTHLLPASTASRRNASSELSLIRSPAKRKLEFEAREKCYELLHYMMVKDVVQEHDELIIRPLTSTELTERVLGGRHQIRGDGRHLFDGIGWGRRRLKRETGRPEITIPPRKRRKIEHDVDENNAIGLLGDGVANEDDDFQSDQDDVGENELLQITERAEFEDADSDQDDEDDEPYADVDEGNASSDSGLDDADLETELTGLLEDAENDLRLLEEKRREFEDFEAASTLPPAVLIPRSSQKKRKAGDDHKQEYDDTAFEGFSTPGRQPVSPIIHNREDSPTTDDSSDSSDDSDSDSDPSDISFGYNDLPSPKDAQKRADGNKSETTTKPLLDDDDWTSSSDITEDEPSLAPAIQDDETTSSSDISTTDESDEEWNSSSSSSSPSSSSSSGSDVGESEDDIVKLPTPNAKLLKPFKGPLSTPNPDLRPLARQVPPGSGSSQTHRNNQRAKRRKRLSSLKEAGLLSADADFTAMDEFLLEQGLNEASELNGESDDFFADINARKANLIEELESHPVVDPVAGDVEFDPFESPEAGITTLASETDGFMEGVTMSQGIGLSEPMSGSPKKRARLDIASSRRLLFGALGVRTPKTAEEEEALREKLSKVGRKPLAQSTNVTNATAGGPPAPRSDDSWRKKLKVSAVECEVQGLKLKPPPFPFEQGWDHEAKARLKSFRSTGRVTDLEGDEDAYNFAPDMSTVHGDVDAVHGVETPTIESRTVSAENVEQETMPIPTDFAQLSSLEPDQILPGTIIAYKELQITPDGQPEVSGFRVARVISVNLDGSLQLQLSKRDRDAMRQALYDSVTGERVYSRFEVPSEENEESDNLSSEQVRPLEDLLESKLVQISSVQVPRSDHGIEDRNQPAVLTEEESSAAIPDSKPEATSAGQETLLSEHIATHIHVATPRRDEITTIIKEAGFDSAINKKLLHPIPSLGGDNRNGSPELASSRRSSRHSSQRRSAEPVAKAAHASLDTSGFDSPRPNNGWMSSPSQAPREALLIHGAETSQITQEAVDQEQQAQGDDTNAATAEVLYPHISQLEVGSSVNTHANSSSHQDAQHVEPLENIDEADITRLEDEPDPPTNVFDDVAGDAGGDIEDLPPSVAEPSQDYAVGPYRQRDQLENDHNSSMIDSFLGPRPLDGSDDSFADDVHNLPSQRRKVFPRTSKVSTPPLKQAILRSSQDESSDQSESPELKISASQRQASPRLSQISEAHEPNDGQPGGQSNQVVIDLTQSSDAVSPGGSDGEFWTSTQTRSKRARYSKGSSMSLRSHGKGKGEEAQQRGDDDLDAEPRVVSDEGLGKRRMLVTRKARV